MSNIILHGESVGGIIHVCYIYSHICVMCITPTVFCVQDLPPVVRAALAHRLC